MHPLIKKRERKEEKRKRKEDLVKRLLGGVGECLPNASVVSFGGNLEMRLLNLP